MAFPLERILGVGSVFSNFPSMGSIMATPPLSWEFSNSPLLSLIPPIPFAIINTKSIRFPYRKTELLSFFPKSFYHFLCSRHSYSIYWRKNNVEIITKASEFRIMKTMERRFDERIEPLMYTNDPDGEYKFDKS